MELGTLPIYFSFLPSVAPMLQPGWFPFRPTAGQKLIFPSIPPATEDVFLQDFSELVFACRMDGRPKVEIIWLLNELLLEVALPSSSYRVMEIVQGRSVLIFDLESPPFNLTNPMQNPLLGPFSVQCQGSNLAGMAEGQAMINGES